MITKRIQVLLSLIPFFLVATLSLVLIIWSQAARSIGGCILTISIGAAIFFIARKDVQACRRGELTRARLWRRLAVDLSGLLLSLAAAIPAAGWAGRTVGQAVWQATGRAWVGIAAGLLAGFAAGFGSGWLVRAGRAWIFKYPTQTE